MRFAGGLAFILSAVTVFAEPSFAGPSKDAAAAALRSAPLRFEQDTQGRWTSRGAGYAFRFESGAAELRLGDRAVSLSFAGSASQGAFEGADRMSAPTNYFVGRKYRSAAAFSHLRQRAIYPGVDVVYYGNGSQLEYDFDLAPGADPSKIRMKFEGTDGLRVNDRGEIVLSVGSGEVVQQTPVVYQRRDSGEVVRIDARYRFLDHGEIGVTLGIYDRSSALVIDPALLYSAYLGGTYGDAAISIGHDAEGYLYLAGYTYSSDFQAGGDVVQVLQKVGTRDAWAMKFDPFASDPGNVILYSTYFGGELDDDLTGMAVDSKGVMYLTGTTLSPDLTVTSGAYQSALSNTNALLNGWMAVIDPSQSGSAGLLYSTFFGTSQTTNPTGISFGGGRISICGWTNADDLPITGLTVQSKRAGGNDGFIAQFDPTQSGAASLVFSTYLGGAQQDVARSIASDSSGRVYVAGLTLSPGFVTTANGFQPNYSDGGGDGFLTLIDPNQGAIVYSTFVGGSQIDVATKVFLEPSGRVALTGYTFSPDFPRTPNAAQPAYGGNGDAFVIVLDPAAPSRSAALVYATYFGGSDGEVGYDIRRDDSGRYYICGYTLSKNLPVTSTAINLTSLNGGLDGFVAVIDPLRSLIYSSYITSPAYQIPYSVDFDAAGNVYVAGLSSGNIFPASLPPHTTGVANYDAFLMVVSPDSARQAATQAAREKMQRVPRRSQRR
jgi:beta-propeller repeat-containing protein